MQTHIELIKLIVAYTLTGAFVFTVAMTCLSLIGRIRFASEAQQKKLFYVLILELTVVCVGFFSDFLKFNPSKVQEAILRDGMSAPYSTAKASEFLASDFSNSSFAMAIFENGQFKSSWFKGAVFSESNFDGARFDYSRFENASFRNARFPRADFRGADLTSITVDENTMLPNVR